MMNELEVNSYIAAASEALQDDPDYKRWFDALVEERKVLLDHGYNSGTVEGLLFSIWNQRIGYILDHLDEIRASIPIDSASSDNTQEV